MSASLVGIGPLFGAHLSPNLSAEFELPQKIVQLPLFGLSTYPLPEHSLQMFPWFR